MFKKENWDYMQNNPIKILFLYQVLINNMKNKDLGLPFISRKKVHRKLQLLKHKKYNVTLQLMKINKEVIKYY